MSKDCKQIGGGGKSFVQLNSFLSSVLGLKHTKVGQVLKAKLFLVLFLRPNTYSSKIGTRQFNSTQWHFCPNKLFVSAHKQRKVCMSVESKILFPKKTCEWDRQKETVQGEKKTPHNISIKREFSLWRAASKEKSNSGVTGSIPAYRWQACLMLHPWLTAHLTL